MRWWQIPLAFFFRSDWNLPLGRAFLDVSGAYPQSLEEIQISLNLIRCQVVANPAITTQ